MYDIQCGSTEPAVDAKMWVFCNPGSTRDLHQLIFLSFVACRTRQVGARFGGRPSKGKR